MLQSRLPRAIGVMVKIEKSDLKLPGTTMMQCSKESMNYWDKLEPTDENVSRLYGFHSKSENGY